jgi:hypothetical protein
MRRIFVLIFIFSIFTVTQAQYSRRITYEQEMYVGASAGMNSYWGEGSKSYMLSMPLSSLGLMGNFVVGYKFTPFFEMQLSPGYVTHNCPDDRRNDTIQSFSAQNMTVDLLWNVSNAIRYNKSRNFTLYVVGGAGIAYRNTSTDLQNALISPVLKGGLQGTFLLNDKLNLNISGLVHLVTDAYNGYPLTGFNRTPVDLYPALTVGLTYHFVTTKHCTYKSIRVKSW